MTRLAALCWMGLILSLAACQTGSQRSVEQAEESAPPAEQAEESAPPADDRTSIVWLKGEADTNSSPDIRAYLGTENLIDVIDTASGSFAVALPPEEVLGLLEKNEKFLSRLDHVEEDTEIFPFQPPRAGCTPQPISAAVNPPWGVKRVGGPAPAGRNSVWIVDSGAEADYQGTYLNIDSRAADCSGPGQCVAGVGAADDLSGHGTMIAGIVGGRLSAGRGVRGVAEGANIVPVKIYDPSSGTASFTRQALKGLDYVYSHRNIRDDVIVISWGAQVVYPVGGPVSGQLAVEQKIESLVADKGVKVVIAAGNLGPRSDMSDCPSGPEPGNLGGGYVQMITPARMQHDRVWTVSAIDENGDFWFFRPTDRCATPGPDPDPVKSPWGSFFGNNYPTRKMPPHYAEPGVNIQSLWIKNGAADQLATCTGTSFAAPHLAGVLLLRPTPDQGGTAKKDPALEEEPVGVCRKSVNPNCTYTSP